jgi:hypothetical protein
MTSKRPIPSPHAPAAAIIDPAQSDRYGFGRPATRHPLHLLFSDRTLVIRENSGNKILLARKAPDHAEKVTPNQALKSQIPYAGLQGRFARDQGRASNEQGSLQGTKTG